MLLLILTKRAFCCFFINSVVISIILFTFASLNGINTVQSIFMYPLLWF